MISIEPATQEAVVELYGEMPGPSCRAVMALKDGEPVAVAGIYRYNAHRVMFTKIKDEIRPDLMKYRRYVIQMIREVNKIRGNHPAIAFADENIKGSERMLKHIGFEKTEEGYYKLEGS